MRFILYSLISLAALVAGAQPQTKSKSETKTGSQAKKEAGPVEGFAVAPMVLKDEGCARDYVRAFQFEGVELRKRLADLVAYGCVDTTAKGIFSGIAFERKDLAVEKGTVVYFRRVLLKFDVVRTGAAVGGSVIPPRSPAYEGWIPEENFYAVSPDQFEKMLRDKTIPMTIKNGR